MSTVKSRSERERAAKVYKDEDVQAVRAILDDTPTDSLSFRLAQQDYFALLVKHKVLLVGYNPQGEKVYQKTDFGQVFFEVSLEMEDYKTRGEGN